MRHVLLLLLVSSTAYAGRHGALERVDNGHAKITFVFQTSSRDPIEIVQPIELPVAMTATGVAVAVGDAEPARSVPLRTAAARRVYDEIVREIRDPALLEAGEHGLVLHVFPVRRGEVAKVTIDLTATSLVEAQQIVHVDEHVSLLAAPEQINIADYAWLEAPYEGYWPVHRD